MNWYWFRNRRRRRITSARGLAHGSTGRLVWRKAARPIGYVGLSVALAAVAAGCTGSPGSTGHGPATSAVSPSLLISRTTPHAPVGRQLTWFLRAMADLPWSQRLIQAHFDSSFLTHISPDQLNSVLGGILAASHASVASSGASLTGLLSQDPAHDPDTLLAVAAFGSVELTVTIAVDGAGLISELALTPYQPPPASWAQVDRELAALAPHVSLLAARVSVGGSCTPVHQVAASAARPLGSMFKLFVLGALAHQIARGRVSWNQPLTVTAPLKSLPSGQLQDEPDGTQISVRDTAAKMISVSDNTAANMLINLVGRSAVQAQDRQS